MEDVPEAVRAELTVHLASRIDEVLSVALQPAGEAAAPAGEAGSQAA
ncbi:MAG: hypothetical protein M0T71_13395 [Actinomycetota bacterium]|nr:hypothetical protein [Actinomycetota bacterium]